MIDELKAILDDREFVERSKSMSGDKWAYKPNRCEGKFCCGDCDYCDLWKQDEERSIDEVNFSDLVPPEDGRVVVNENGLIVMSIGTLAKLQDPTTVRTLQKALAKAKIEMFFQKKTSWEEDDE